MCYCVLCVCARTELHRLNGTQCDARSGDDNACLDAVSLEAHSSPDVMPRCRRKLIIRHKLRWSKTPSSVRWRTQISFVQTILDNRCFTDMNKTLCYSLHSYTVETWKLWRYLWRTVNVSGRRNHILWKLIIKAFRFQRNFTCTRFIFNQVCLEPICQPATTEIS